MIRSDIYKYFPFLEKNSNSIENPKNSSVEGKLPSSKIKNQVEIDSKKQKLYDVALEFESLFVKIMLNSMRKTLNKENDLFYAGLQQDIFEDMLYDEYAKIFSKNANLGLAKEMYKQLESYVTEEDLELQNLNNEIQNQKNFIKQMQGIITTEKIHQEWYR